MTLDVSRETVRRVLATAKRPALMWSGGKESQLLLWLIREVVKDIPLLWFRTDREPAQTKFAKQMIHDFNLQVFSYAPAEVYFVPNGDEITLIHEYSFGRNRFPSLIDIECGEKCSLKLDPMRTLQMSHVWDAIFLGVRDDDHHLILGQGQDFLPEDGYWLGDAQVYSPLRKMSEENVWDAINELHVPVDRQRYSGDESRDDGTLKLCTECFNSPEKEVFCPEEKQMIPTHKWDRQASLGGFRQFYGLEA